MPAGGLSIRELVEGLGKEYPRLAPVLASARFVRNGTFVSGRQGRILPGDEFAVHPPYSGG